jgi:hypothetical protein
MSVRIVKNHTPASTARIVPIPQTLFFVTTAKAVGIASAAPYSEINNITFSMSLIPRRNMRKRSKN